MAADRAPAEILKAENAGRTYRSGKEEVTALTGAELSFHGGELTVLRGRSGSGKTTLLNLAGLLDRPTEGRIIFLGKDTRRMSDRKLALMRRGNLGYVLQDSGVVERMSALANAALPGFYAGLSPRKSRKLARAALEAVELGPKLHRPVGQLSGGERMRVGLARALVLSPRLVICDEPTASLDAETANLVITRLREAAARGACILCASHDPIVIERADRLITLTGGKITGDERAREGGAP
ncbi:ABC transporter ATP-binding protein [Synechococcus moorigangaii CMS01]|nr:ABC transporter ATP-binding protein [Synechococcus moorigangaii CMS01]